MRIFNNEADNHSGDNDYFKWMSTNGDGYVVNTGRPINSMKATLHRSNCDHISGYVPEKGAGKSYDNHHTGKQVIKVCSNDLLDLYIWCQENRKSVSNGFDKLCKNCFPDQEIVWRELLSPTAIDIDEPIQPSRVRIETYRIIRDSATSREIKQLYQNECQLCGESLRLKDGREYSEVHHIQPLGKGGPDIRENILCVCPNHHALLDFVAIPLNNDTFKQHPTHRVDQQYISYHNEMYLR